MKIKWLSASLVTAMLAGCTPAKVTTQQAYMGPILAAPTRVVVTDFTIAPERVELDQAIGARLQRAAGNESPETLEANAAAETQAALAQELARKLGSYGLNAAPLPPGSAPPPGALLVQGQITGINQGNRARRVVIGLGAGRSSVTADAQLYVLSDSGTPRLLQSFHGSSDSGRMPGAVGTMGVGAAAGSLGTSAALSGGMHGVSEMHRTTDEENATRLADALAKQIGDFAAAQGWIAAAAVQ